MFQNRTIYCPYGGLAQLVCTYVNCPSYLFVCARNCECVKEHQKGRCELKNIRGLVNGIQTVLKRNFWKEAKGQGIQIVGRTVVQTFPTPRNFRFCLTQCKADGKKDMEFQVKTIKGCIGVGIMHLPTLVSCNFQYLPDGDYINHGSYMLLSNGYQYSHSSLEQNFIEYKGIKLEEESRVHLSMVGNKLILSQGCHRVILDIPVELVIGGQMYFGVYLYEVGDEVEVLAKRS